MSARLFLLALASLSLSGCYATYTVSETPGGYQISDRRGRPLQATQNTRASFRLIGDAGEIKTRRLAELEVEGGFLVGRGEDGQQLKLPLSDVVSVRVKRPHSRQRDSQ